MKRTKMILVASAIIVCVISLVNCERGGIQQTSPTHMDNRLESNDASPQDLINLPVKSVPLCFNPENKANPIDFIGKVHNECMDVAFNQMIISCREKQSLEQAKKNVQNSISRYIKKNYFPEFRDFQFTKEFRYIKSLDPEVEMKMDFIAYAKRNNLFDNQVSEIIYPYIDSISPILDNLYDCKIDKSKSYRDFYLRTLIIENKIIKDRVRFSDENFNRLMIFFSIFRHSIAYHTANLSNTNSPIANLINMESSDESSIAQKTWNYVNGFLIYADWDAIGAKDAIWGAAGGFSGGFWGVLGGALGGSVDELYNQTNSSGGVIIIWNGWLVYP